MPKIRGKRISLAVMRLGVMDDRTSLIGTTNTRVTINAAAVNKTEEKKP